MIRSLLACLGVALVTAPAALAGPAPLLVGATDRYLAEPSLAGSEREARRLQRAGLDAARLALLWSRGETSLGAGQLAGLENATTAAQDEGIRLFLSVYPANAGQTPLAATQRAAFAAWAASIARAVPSVHDFIVGNEPNHDRYWLPQFGPDGQDVAATAFEQLLASTYDALEAVSPQITVWGCGCARSGSDTGRGRQTHSPVRFLEDMGAAYRASGRTRPIMDGLAYHPYMRSSATPPTFRHLPASTTMTIADYAHLVRVLGTAFDGTAQKGSTLPILYDEFGVDATVPPSEQEFYAGHTPVSIHRVDPSTQARYYTAALQLASCEPNVRGLLIFPFEDERNLARWQSGLYYLNAVPRPSLDVVRRDAAEIRAGTFVDCSFLRTTLRTTILYRPQARDPGATLTCDSPCVYRLRLVRVGGSVTAERYGRERVATLQRVDLAVRLAPGRYRFDLVIWPARARAAPESDRSPSFSVGPS